MKTSETLKDDLRSEYQSADFPAGLTRGKYAARVHTASNIAILEPLISPSTAPLPVSSPNAHHQNPARDANPK
jgi:hypothetical protein